MGQPVKFVESLKVYRPDWDAKKMVEDSNGFGIVGQYVTAEQVDELLKEHVAELDSAIETHRREVAAVNAQITRLENVIRDNGVSLDRLMSALQQAQGGR
jgi:hypothetical protein